MHRQDNNRVPVWDGLFYNDIPSIPQLETFDVAVTKNTGWNICGEQEYLCSAVLSRIVKTDRIPNIFGF